MNRLKIALTALVVLYSCAFAQSVVINEIGWMGTAASDTDEWLELYNASDNPVDLTGWSLKAVDGTPSITLNGTVAAHGFFLLERTDDNTISDCPANQIYTGALGNSGEFLQLVDQALNVVDQLDCSAGGWFGGSNSPKVSMERKHPALDGNLPSNWASNNTTKRNGLDAAGAAVNATPGQPNSVLDSTLPVELESFTAIWRDGQVVLTWSVQSQVNNQGYKILKSEMESGPFHAISGLIPGAGSTTQRQNFNYNDDRVIAHKTYWYQLQQFDFDGHEKIYGKLSVYTGANDPFVPATSHLLHAYPNPFNPGVTLRFVLANPALVNVQVFDVLGRSIYTLADQKWLQTGQHDLYWHGRDAVGQSVPAGVYFIRLQSDQGIFCEKVFKCD
jgi:hypothetical protein